MIFSNSTLELASNIATTRYYYLRKPWIHLEHQWLLTKEPHLTHREENTLSWQTNHWLVNSIPAVKYGGTASHPYGQKH